MKWTEQVELGKQNMHFLCKVVNLQASDLYVSPIAICEMDIGKLSCRNVEPNELTVQTVMYSFIPPEFLNI